MADIDLGPLVPRSRLADDCVVAVNNTVSPTETMALIPFSDFVPKPESGPSRFYVFEDYLGGGVPSLVQGNAGTGSGTTLTNTNVDTVGCGWLQFNLGTTTTGRVHQTLAPVIIFSSGAARCRNRVRMTALSNATDTYTFRSGFIDTNAGESVDGAFFRYTHSVNGGKFQCVTRSNNVETATDSGIMAAVNTNYILEAIVNAAGTEVLFYIDGVLVQTHTTNIPTGGGRETGAGVGAIRSAGTAAYTPFWVDYVLIEYERGAR